MMVKASFVHKNGKTLGTKSIPEDCLAVRYGGSTFVKVAGGGEPHRTMYLMTDTFHTSELDQQ